MLGKAMWLGRTTCSAVGLAVIVGVVVSLTAAALAGNGVGARFDLGEKNTVNKISKLVGSDDNPMLRVDNSGAGANATALDLRVEANKPPMRVNSSREVTGLNADQLDGLSASSFIRSSVYRNESAINAGTMLGDGTFRADASCLPGDRMLSGGPANIAATSDLLESFPNSTVGWSARIEKNGSADDFNVVVLCAVIGGE